MMRFMTRTILAVLSVGLAVPSALSAGMPAATNSQALFPVAGLRVLPAPEDEVVGTALKSHAGLMQAVAALRAGLPAEALGGLGEAAALPGNTGAVATYFYAEALVRVEKPGNALYYYNDLLSRFPGHALADDALLGIALVYVEAGRSLEAVSWLERLVEDCPRGDRVPLARMLLDRLTRDRLWTARPETTGTGTTVKPDGGGVTTAVRPVDDGREKRLDARERLLAEAEQRLDVDRKRVLALEAQLLAKKQQLDQVEKNLAARALALDKREKELKDFENR